MQFDKKTIMSIFIAAIMVISVIGFALTFATPTEQLEYNGYKFARTSQGLQTKVNGIRLTFYYYPAEIADIPFPDEAKQTIEGSKVLWFSYDPNDLYAPEIADVFFYIEEALAAVKDVYAQRGLINSTGYDLPEITCANATSTVPVLIMRQGNETKIEASQNCVIVNAAIVNDVYKAGDRLLYQAFNVMK